MDVMETNPGSLSCKELIRLGRDRKGLANYMCKAITYFTHLPLFVIYACIPLFRGKWTPY